MKNYSYSKGKLFFYLLLAFTFLFTADCSKKKKRTPFWMIALTGNKSSSIAGGGGSGTGTDSNGVALPTSTTTGEPTQEVASSGPATISGTIIPTINGVPVCKNPPANSLPAGCAPETGSNLDLTLIQVQLVDSNGNVLATTFLNADGSYNFNMTNLVNGNYRVLINSGNGLNAAYQDFNFTFNPTVSGPNQVNLADISASRLYYQSGPAVISGTVNTPGFNGDVVIPAGPLAGVTVELRDNSGNLVATTTTNASGNYSFNQSNLANGNYTVHILGNTISSNGRPFETIVANVPFQFSGNDNQIPTNVNVNNANLTWQAATSSSATITARVINAAITPGSAPSGTNPVPSNDLTNFTGTLKDAAGNVIATTTADASGNFNFNLASLPSGVYSIEASRPNFITSSSSFLFTAHSAGGNRVVNLSSTPISSAPRIANITGTVTDGSLPYIPGSVINFRPSTLQAPSNLAYLLNSANFPGLPQNVIDTYRNSAGLWMREACVNRTACNTACAAGGYQPSCIIANQGTGPWTYNTYGNKLYEVTNNIVRFTATAGIWDFYISAPGYANSSVQTISLNGSDYNNPPIQLVASSQRAQIAGQTVVLDTLSNGTTRNSYGAGAPGFTNAGFGLPGLFVVMLGNTDNSGNPVAHITTTNASGQYSFGANSKVVSLPSNLTDDASRISYAISQFATAKLLNDTTNNVTTANSPTSSVDLRNGTQYNFRNSSYAIFVADPLGHISTGSTQADLSAVATNSYTSTPVTLNVVNNVLHNPRRSVTGVVSDAISTALVSGATVTLGRIDANNQFVADIRRDCTNASAVDSQTCAISNASRLGIGTDTVVGSVNTNANGQYSINNINPGNYTIRVSYNGMDSYFNISVPTSGPATVLNMPIVTQSGNGNLTGFVKTPGGFNYTGAYSLELVNPSVGTRPTPPVTPASLSSGGTSFSNQPNYTIFKINAGSWRVNFTAPGMVPVTGLVNIQNNATTNFDIIVMVPNSTPAAAISGRALSALNNQGIGGLTVRIRPGVNVNSGAYATGTDGITTIPAVTTNADGSYAIPNVPPGNYTIEVSGSNVITSFETVISAGTQTPSNQNILVSPILGASEIRIVLSWDAKPRDLDSHLEYGNASCSGNTVFAADSGKCQVVWNQPHRNKLGGDLNLDFDITTGYGPETITAKNTFWTNPAITRRGYSVFNWSNDAVMNTSGANVRVFKSTGLVRTYSVGAGQVSRWWQIFCLDSNRNIIDVGQAGCNVNDFFNAPQN
jgi:hypothetical protein